MKNRESSIKLCISCYWMTKCIVQLSAQKCLFDSRLFNVLELILKSFSFGPFDEVVHYFVILLQKLNSCFWHIMHLSLKESIIYPWNNNLVLMILYKPGHQLLVSHINNIGYSLTGNQWHSCFLKTLSTQARQSVYNHCFFTLKTWTTI